MKGGRDALDAVIIGAGMVGAAAALALARSGLRVALVERQAPESPAANASYDLRVVAIAPHAQRLLHDLGVWDAISAQRAAPYARMQVVDAQGGADLQFDAAEYGWPSLGHIVENRVVAGALWRALQAEPNVRVLDDALSSFSPEPSGVRVRLSGDTILQTHLLIGADGVDSQVRADLMIGVDGQMYPQSAVVAQLRLQRAEPQLAWQRFLSSGPLALLPLADGSVSMVWTLPSAPADALVLAPVEQFEAQVQRATADHFGRVSLLSSRRAFPLRRQIAQTFVDQRVILIGDAAHVVHPLAGQGVNLGFADVSELIEAIARARASQRTPLSDSDLQRWARARRSEATLAARAFDSLNRLYAVHEGPLVAMRAIGLRLVDRVVPLKRKFAEHAAGIRAGI